jgi:hypothetical protein
MQNVWTVKATLSFVVLLMIAREAPAQPQCPGDMNRDGQVTVDEILTSVNNALGGCPVRFVDNGDGTITDHWSGLMWEKKSDDGSIHDQDDRYSWCAIDSSGFGCADPSNNPADGTAFTEFLATLEQQAFAGYTDWRLPTVEEFITLIDFSRSAVATDPVFADEGCAPGCTVIECSCTASSIYWSSSTFDFFETQAFELNFRFGTVFPDKKDGLMHVRAVRGPL